MHIRRQEHVERLGLADMFRPVAGQFDQPALVQFKGSLEDLLLPLIEAVEVLDASGVGRDAGPEGLPFGGVTDLRGQQAFQFRVPPGVIPLWFGGCRRSTSRARCWG